MSNANANAIADANADAASAASLPSPHSKDDKAITLPTSGRLGHLTPKEAETLDELRVALLKAAKFVPERHDDHTLLRFLRARQFVLQKSLEMLLNYEQWRVSFNLDFLVKSFDFKERAEVMKLYPQYFHNIDKLGRPVYIEHLGLLKISEIKKVTSLERLKQRVVVEYENMLTSRMPVCSIHAKTHIEQSCTIIDLDGVSIWEAKSAIELIREISAIASDYYPEIMGTMLIVNAPSMFSGLWSLIKVFLDAKTVEKIEIHSKKSTATAILKYVPSCNVPKTLGGECDCVAKNCRDQDYGPWKTMPAAEINEYRTRQVVQNTTWATEQRAKLGIPAAEPSVVPA